MTRNQGTGSTLTTRVDGTSSSTGTAVTQNTVVLNETPVWAIATANAGYNTAVLKEGNIERTASGYKIVVTANVTISSSVTSNELTFDDKTITKTYSTSVQTDTINEATNGLGEYTYTITAGNNNNYFSISGTTINIKASTPAGTYLLTIQAKDTRANTTKNATYTVIINKANLATPVVSIDTDGNVIWNNIPNATAYEISFDNNSWTTALSSSKKIDTSTIRK